LAGIEHALICLKPIFFKIFRTCVSPLLIPVSSSIFVEASAIEDGGFFLKYSSKALLGSVQKKKQITTNDGGILKFVIFETNMVIYILI